MMTQQKQSGKTPDFGDVVFKDDLLMRVGRRSVKDGAGNYTEIDDTFELFVKNGDKSIRLTAVKTRQLYEFLKKHEKTIVEYSEKERERIFEV